MTEKRFTYDSKTVSMLKDGEFWLDGNVDTACNHSEICNELNKLADENEQLKKEAEEYNENAMSYQTLYEQQLEKFEELLSKYKHQQEQKMKFCNENKELKQTIHRLKQNIDELFHFLK